MADPVIVDDTNSSIVYSPSSAWAQGGASQEQGGTTHFTTSAGAAATFTFNGTLVQVFGTINMDANTTHHLVSSYTIDGLNPTIYTAQPSAFAPQYKVQFFKSPTLQSGQHTLVINNIVIGSQLDTDLFFLDYIQFFPNTPNTTTTSAITSTTSSAITSTTSSATSSTLTSAALSTTTSTVSQSPEVASPHSANISTGALIGAVIGAVIPFLVIIAFLIWYLRRRMIKLTHLIETEKGQKVIATRSSQLEDGSDMPLGLRSA